ncbi:MAG: kelch repeat-containing protein [Gemmatimonadaceae bacterium]
MILIGGIDPATLDNFSDQWEWSGQAWTRTPNVTAPTAGTFGGALVADEHGALYLMLSRESDRRVVVYTAAGGAWQLRDASGAPTASAFAVARAPGGGVLLFGGATDAGVVGDSWLWNGSTWTRLNVAGPPARTGHAMAYDVVRNRIVLYGGESATQAFADTWEFDGSAWRQVP